jgi:hypothetical protein
MKCWLCELIAACAIYQVECAYQVMCSVLLGICGELVNRVRELALSTVQETVQVNGHAMCRAAPFHAYVSRVVSSGDASRSSLIMPGSRVRVPPLLLVSQSLHCGWLTSF